MSIFGNAFDTLLSESQRASRLFKESIALVGREVLHAQYPKDIEAYFTAIEVLDKDLNSIFYFPFVYNPSSYNRENPTRTSIKETLGGINVIRKKSFTQRPIVLTGSFGRKWNVVFPNAYSVGADFFFDDSVSVLGDARSTASTYSSKTIKTSNQLNVQIKSGYGVWCVLDAIFEKVKSYTGEGSPLYMVLYNGYDGENYVVEPVNWSSPHTVQRNMIYDYRIELMAVAPINALLDKSRQQESTNNSLTNSVLQRVVNNSVNSAQTKAMKIVLNGEYSGPRPIFPL